MACTACDIDVRAGQCELGRRIMAERRIGPGGRAVTDGAVLRKAGSAMGGIIRAVPIRLVTRDARGCHAGEDIALVTHAAGHARVGARQREFGGAVVVEIRVGP